MRIGLLAAALLLIPLTLAQGQPAPGDAETPKDDITERPVKWTFGAFSASLAADLKMAQGGARNAGGEIVIDVGDRLLSWDGRPLKTRDDFCRELYQTVPGQLVKVGIERTDKETKTVSSMVVEVKLGDYRERFAPLYERLSERERSHNWLDEEALDTSGNHLTKALDRLLKGHKLDDDWSNLVSAHKLILDLWSSYETTSACERLLTDPAASDAFIRAVTEPLTQEPDYRWVMLGSLGKLLDKAEGTERAAFPPGGMDAVTASLRALDLTASARKGLGEEDWAKLVEGIRDFDYKWHGEEGHEKCAEVVQLCRRAKLPLPRFLLELNDSMNFLTDGLRSLARKEDDGSDGAVLFEAKTEWGRIAVGGKGRNRWTGHYAAILDLGGDDVYENVGAPGERVCVIIDRAGNDRYESDERWGVGAGAAGVSIIHDIEGDDSYRCGEYGLGAAFCGVGLIVDETGNDRYLGGDQTIGCAAYGIGGVIDFAGNDVYDSHVYSVGVGLPGGVGVVLDRDGDDRFKCTGKYGSGYGTEGEYTGWGLGCGFGYRGLAAGGTGMLIDMAGNDIYDTGEFGLGCGYFMGVGLVRDFKGDDIYHSSRYGLATAAHYAVGLFMDDAGNDTYEGKTAASMAGVWDIATGYFYDGAGDDNYRCQGLGLGACSQNGFGIFWDASGNDNYRGANSSIGFAGDSAYGGGRLARNFGLFLDTGGQDSYSRIDRKNGQVLLEREFALFIDSAEPDNDQWGQPQGADRE